MADRLARFVGRWYSVALVLAAWELVARSGWVPRRLVPSLVDIAQAFWHALASGDLAFHAGVSLMRALTGFALALVAGFALGALMARRRAVEQAVEPTLSFFYPLPRIALYPVFIFIFGLGHASKIALVALECLFPITLHAYAGIRQADRILLWAGSSMGASASQLFWRVQVPAAAPTFFTGLRIALPLALIVVITTEIIGESVGLGYFVNYAAASFDTARSLAGLLAVAIIGFALDRTVVALRRRLVFWQRDTVPIV
jgi:ABC-type nitrate/sulfonate/bicarbonate transport system permease component